MTTAFNLRFAYSILGVFCFLLVVYLIICYQFSAIILNPIPEDERMVLRTAFYVMAIISFPFTSLVRHILLRLNQTMPIEQNDKRDVTEELIIKTAYKRYVKTVFITLALMNMAGLEGLIIFALGDGFNTLHILSILCALGLFVHRPKEHELISIIEHLKQGRT